MDTDDFNYSNSGESKFIREREVILRGKVCLVLFINEKTQLLFWINYTYYDHELAVQWSN